MATGLGEIMADTYTEATSLALIEGPPFKAPGCIARGADRLPYMYIQIDIDIYMSIDIYIYILCLLFPFSQQASCSPAFGYFDERLPIDEDSKKGSCSEFTTLVGSFMHEVSTFASVKP